MYSKTEVELINATGFDQHPMTYENRSDYLKMLQQAVNNADEDVWDSLSEEAQDWANNAANAVKGRKSIPDFTDLVQDDEPTEVENGDETQAPDSSADEGGVDVEVEASIDASQSDTPTPRKRSNKKRGNTTRAVPSSGKGKSSKKVLSNKELLEVPLDEYGCIEGSKTSQAIKIFEKGCRMKEIKAKLGGTYYNILRKLKGEGHSVVTRNGLITLTHKDRVK